MATNSAQEKQQAHQLIDHLEPDQLSAVVHLLEVMTDPVGRAIVNASVEDEDITDETASALDRAHVSIERGEGIPHDEILREFGIAPRR